MLGRTLAQYRILAKLGAGGMGEVYLAEDTNLERRVAVKVLTLPSQEQRHIVRFEQEAKAVAALDHPNVLAIHDYGRDGETSYIVTEFLEGETLRDRLRRGPLDAETCVDFFSQIASGVAAAHDKGILHRDLKPENIFITQASRIKLLDFGLAKVLQLDLDGDEVDLSAATATLPGTVVGTIGYMAPEQAVGGSVDFRSDIFALGATLYECLCGQRAFAGKTAAETVALILSHHPPIDRMTSVGVPPGLVQVVQRCLEKSPDQRFQTVPDFAVALQAGQDRPDRPLRSATRPIPGESPAIDPSIAVLPFANMSAEPDTQYFSDGMSEEVIGVLTQIRGLRVAARSSSFAFRGDAVDLHEVGSRLNVAMVLQGSVRRAGNRLRVSAQLINVADGFHLWSERYDRESGDVFEIQDDIARSIAGRLQIALSVSTSMPVAKPPSSNVEAYDLFLKGRYLIARRGEDMLKGLEFMDRAIQLDDEFAMAYAASAEALALMGSYGALRPRDVMPKAKAAADKALDLDPESAEVHNAVGLVKVFYDWDWEATEREFNKALELDPDYSPAHYWCGLLYHQFVRLDSVKALEHARRGLELDPLAALPASALGLVQLASGLYEDAVTTVEAALSRDPAAFLLRRIKGVACTCLNRHEEAIDELERGAVLSGRNPSLVADLGAAYVAAGQPDRGRACQSELERRHQDGWIPPTMLAITPSVLGDLDHAADFLELAFEERDPFLTAMRSWPPLKNVCRTERARSLVRRMGLEGGED